MAILENIPFSELHVGQTATYTRGISQASVEQFAAASGDINPLHLDPEFAKSSPFGEPIAHGMLSGGIISAAIALELPGPGSVYVSQSLQFLRPMKAGDELTVGLEITALEAAKRRVTLACVVKNQSGKAVVKGEAIIIASAEKITYSKPQSV